MGELAARGKGSLRPSCESWWTMVGLFSCFIGAVGLLTSILNPFSLIGATFYLAFGTYVVLSASTTLRAKASQLLGTIIPQGYHEM